MLLPEQQNNPQVIIENNRREETADLTSRDLTHEQRTTMDDEKECFMFNLYRTSCFAPASRELRGI